MNIGTVKLHHGLLLAPMAGVSDHAFRCVCRRYGAEYTVSEMVSAKAICYGNEKTGNLLRIAPDDVPEAVQLFGHEPEYLAEAARRIASGELREAGEPSPAAIDLNFGCPVPKIVSGGDGSALLKTPERIGELIRAVKESVRGVSDLPVTVKIRIGWDEHSINAVDVARIAEQAGADVIAVHGRTRKQMYMGKADRSVIAAVKSAVTVPVIANGDIDSAESAVDMFRSTGCDGLMIGRGALGNPFLFAEIRARLEGVPYAPPAPKERIDTAALQFQMMLDEYGEKNGLLQARKHLAWYLKGIRGAARIRDQINRTEDRGEVLSLLYSAVRGEEVTGIGTDPE